MNNKISLVENADCMDFMKKYPDKYFDLAIVDPPYGINADRQHFEGHGWILREFKSWDNEPPNETYFLELFRVSKNQIIWGGNYFCNYLTPKMSWIIWDKMQPNFKMSDGEMAWVSTNTKMKIFRYARANESGFAPKLKGTERAGINIHPTQKPIELYKWLLKNYANEGDKILDTHLGSGSSRIAADKMGFDFYACELDRDYFEAQEKRFKQYKSQLILF
jgi:site-specific DNA-methyltransferase (adenine-specific)